MTTDTRRYWLSLGLSVLLNLVALILVGQFNTSPRPLSQPTKPRLQLMTVRVFPPPKPHLKPKPLERKVAIRRPGAHAHFRHPAPLARQASRHPGGSHSRSPLPMLAARIAAPPPTLTVTRIRHTKLLAHHSSLHDLKMRTLDTTAAPSLETNASGTNAGKGTDSAGQGTQGKGDGSGKGDGAGDGAGLSSGEPFGVGEGTEGEGGPRHVVYVLDISGSMISRIDKAESELRKALSGLQPDESFDIVAFSDHIQSFDNALAPATPEMVHRADGFLNSLQVVGGTDLEGALDRALSLPDVNSVIVLTDGVPTVGETNFKKIARHVREINTNHAVISTVGMVGKNPDGTDDSFEASKLLQQIANESGGDSKLVPLGVATPE